MTTPRRLLALLVCFAFSGFGLFFFLRGTEWEKLAATLRGGNYLWLLPALLLTLCTYVVRAYRWQILMNPIKRIRWIHLLSATTIGFMANCVLPARVGELVRATAIGLKEKMSAATALTTVLVERVFDLFGVAFFVVVVLVLMPSGVKGPAGPPAAPAQVEKTAAPAGNIDASPQKPPKAFSFRHLRMWGFIVGAVTVGTLAVLLLMKLYPSATIALGSIPLKLLPRGLAARGERILMSLVAGLAALESPQQILYLAVLSVFHWGLGVVSNVALARCFNLDFSFADASFLFVITALAVALPQGPGFVGVFDSAGLMALTMLSVSHDTAQGFTIVLHFIAVAPVTIVGFCFLWWEGLSFRQVTGEKDKES